MVPFSSSQCRGSAYPCKGATPLKQCDLGLYGDAWRRLTFYSSWCFFFLITNDFLASLSVLMIIFTSLSLLHASWSRPYFMTQPNLIQLTKSNPRDEGRERGISESARSFCPNNRRLQVATRYPWPQPTSLQSMVNLHWKGTGLPVVLYGMCMFNGN